jgi:hypothetical protein
MNGITGHNSKHGHTVSGNILMGTEVYFLMAFKNL